MIAALLAFPSTPTWALDDADDAAVTRQGRALAVSWIAKNPVDVSVAGEPDATPKAAKLVAMPPATVALPCPRPGRRAAISCFARSGRKL